MVEALLAAGADVTETTSDGESAAYGAARSGRVDVLERLVEAGVPTDATAASTLAHEAAFFGHSELLRWLAAKGHPVGTFKPFYGDGTVGGHHTPLHLAASRGDLAAVQTLLELGADPRASDPADEPDHQGSAPLHDALNAGHDDVIDVLFLAAPEVYDWPHTKYGIVPRDQALQRERTERLDGLLGA